MRVPWVLPCRHDRGIAIAPNDEAGLMLLKLSNCFLYLVFRGISIIHCARKQSGIANPEIKVHFRKGCFVEIVSKVGVGQYPSIFVINESILNYLNYNCPVAC